LFPHIKLAENLVVKDYGPQHTYPPDKTNNSW